MKRTVFLLAFLLGVQLLLGWWLVRTGPDHADPAAAGPLLAVDTAGLTAIEITDDRGQSITLLRNNADWTVSEPEGFPADAHQVAALLENLSSLRGGWPVATSADARRRFKVTASNFQRRVALQGESGKPTVLLLGTSAGLRQSHARLEGSELIHRVALTTAQLGVEPGYWQDRGALRRDISSLQAVRFNAMQLTQTDGRWQLDSDATADGEAIAALVRRITDLRFQSAHSAATPPGGAPDFHLQLQPKQGAAIDYDFYKLPEQPLYRLFCSDRPQWFEVAEATVQAIRGTTASQLTQPEPDSSGNGETPTAP